MKVQWQGEVVSVQPRSAVWRYLIDNRTHREYGYNVFLKGEVRFNDETVHLDNKFDKYDYCVAVSEKQAVKEGISIGDIIKGTGWTKKYPEIEFADFYRAGSLKKLKAAETSHSTAMSIEIDTVNTRYDGTPIPRVNSADYPGPPWKQAVPPLEIYAWRGERMLSKAAWKGKCFRCIWANMANVTIQYDFDRNIANTTSAGFLFYDAPATVTTEGLNTWIQFLDSDSNPISRYYPQVSKAEDRMNYTFIGYQIPDEEIYDPVNVHPPVVRAFYLLPKCSGYYGTKAGDRVIENSTDLAMYLLEEGHVATVPGSAFGAPDCLRLSYATSDENIMEAVDRIKCALSALKRD